MNKINTEIGLDARNNTLFVLAIQYLFKQFYRFLPFKKPVNTEALCQRPYFDIKWFDFTNCDLYKKVVSLTLILYLNNKLCNRCIFFVLYTKITLFIST